MSSETPVVNPTAGTPEQTAGKSGDIEWGYSGKALRAQYVLYWFITIVLLVLGVVLSVELNRHYAWIWGSITVLLAIGWIQFCCVYFYRTWSIRYKLTDLRLYSYTGLFTKAQDSMELVFIEDIQLTQTFWDRLLNGSVGTIKIYSNADKTNPRPEEGGNSVLVISGVDNPQEKFERIDNIRSELRKRRAMLATG
jgi:hypothetical protein